MIILKLNSYELHFYGLDKSEKSRFYYYGKVSKI